MSCRCHSDFRCLALVSAQFEEAYPELIEFAGSMNWRHYPELGVIRTELGTGLPLASIGDLLNFLRGVLDPHRVSSLRGAWIDERPLDAQLTTLLHAGPLVDLAEGDSSVLLEILNERRIETYYQPIFTCPFREPFNYPQVFA